MAKGKSKKSPDTPDTPVPPQPPEPPAAGGNVHIERYVHSDNAGPPPRTPTPPTTGKSASEAIGRPFRQAYVRKQAAIFLKQVADHFVLYDPLAQTFLRLNRPALSVWEAVGDQERRYVPEIISNLSEGNAPLDKDDVEATLAAFVDNGMLTIVTTNRE